MNTKFLLMVTFLSSFLFMSTISSAEQTAQPTQELVLLNWSEYLDPDLIEKFEKEHGIKIRQALFASDDLRDDMMLETDGKGFDMVIINGVTIETYVKKGWMAKIDTDKVPNLKYIEDRWRNAFPASKQFAVPYFWGTVGIAYRSDLVKKPPTSWMDIMRPEKSMHGKISMIESAREVFFMALKALDYSLNSSDSKEIKEAEALLMEQRPFVKDYTYIALDEKSTLLTGETVVAMCYSGDVLFMMEYNDNIKYVVPKEGTNLWIDYLAVLSGSKKKELAWKFINFMNEPENAAQMAQWAYYASPNKAAKKLLPKEFLENKIIYPDEEIMARSEIYVRLPPRAAKKRNTGFARVMRK